MKTNVISFKKYKDREKEVAYSADTKTTTQSFIHRVDRSLVNMNAYGYEYINKLITGVYESIGGGCDKCTDLDFILRIECEVKKCNTLECQELLRKVKRYLQTPTVSESQEKKFMIHVHNKVYERFEDISGNHLREV